MIPIERIAGRTYLIRGQDAMLGSDLAELYGVSAPQLNQQVKRNIARFPPCFAFQLKKQEFAALMSHIVTSYEKSRGVGRINRVFFSANFSRKQTLRELQVCWLIFDTGP